MAYDALLLTALWMVAGAIWVAIHHGAAPPGDHLFQLYLLIIAFGFFGLFWTLAGRTLGMQAWRLRLVTLDGGRPGWREASIRFAAALLSWLPLGLGYLWALFDPQKRTWHDRLSGTRLVLDPKGYQATAT
jgi:uncharacterized RDD family membrane protein YckC